MIEVRDMLGHRSVTTTERYAHLSESALQLEAIGQDRETGWAEGVRALAAIAKRGSESERGECLGCG
jgi:hypothetical protein